MSNVTNQKRTFWKMVRMDSGSEHQTRSHTIKCSKLMFAALLCDQLSLDPANSRDDKARCSKICSLVSQSSIGGLVALSDTFRKIVTEDWLLDIIDLPGRTDRFTVESGTTYYVCFKHILQGYLEPPCFELFCQCKTLIVNFADSPTGENALPLNMLACFITRINIVRDELKWELATDFHQRDERLKHYHESNTGESCLVRTMREVVGEWFSDFSFENLIPHHGPGAAAELTAQEAYLGNKYAKLGTDARLRLWLSKWVPNWRDFYPVDELFIPPFIRESKLVFVPKSIKTLRAINKIPITLMYWQQGVKDQLYAHMRKTKAIHRVIQLEDSTVNAELCVLGSKYGNFGTIDLSAASDSVSYQLVKDVFGQCSVLIDAFEALRCDACTIEESRGVYKTFQPEKFAPMGEPLCFPIECIVFASCIEAVLRNAGVPREHTHKYYNVYGDDMVVKSEYCDEVISALTELGFSVNREKSFVDRNSVFRESCGVEAYLGEDVTPIRIPRSLVHPSDLGLRDLKRVKVHIDKRLKLKRIDVAAAYLSTLFLEELRPIWNKSVQHNYTNLKCAILSMIDTSCVWWTDDASEGWLTAFPSNYRRSACVGISEDYQRPYREFYTFPRVDWKQSTHTVTSIYGYQYQMSDDAYRRFHWHLMANLNASDRYQLSSSCKSKITTRAPAVSLQLTPRALR